MLRNKPNLLYKENDLEGYSDEDLIGLILDETGFVVQIGEWHPTYHSVVRDPSIAEEVYVEWEGFAKDLEDDFDKDTIAFHMPRVEQWAKDRDYLGEMSALDYFRHHIAESCRESHCDSVASRRYM